MVVNLYAHLVEEMRRKEAFPFPPLEFNAKTMQVNIARNHCQDDEGRHVPLRPISSLAVVGIVAVIAIWQVYHLQ